MPTPPTLPDGSPMPPTPQEATQKAMANAASNMAQKKAEQMVMRMLKPYLPSTIIHRLEKAANNMVSNLIWSCAFFVIFVVAFGAVGVFIVGVVAYSLVFH